MTQRAAIAALVLLVAACSSQEKRGEPPPAASDKPSPQGATAAGADRKATSFHAFSAAPLGETTPVSFAKYQGKVLLVANTASHCGYTPQYTPLGEVDRKYKEKGFAVLGIVSDDFGHQAGTTEEVKACSVEHKATFDQIAELHAKKGPDQHPIFAWLTSQPGLEGDVKWNFNKWLIGKRGELIARWPSDVAPDAPEVITAIERALAR